MDKEKFLKEESDIILINYKLENQGQKVMKNCIKIRSGSMLRKAKRLREIIFASCCQHFKRSWKSFRKSCWERGELLSVALLFIELSGPSFEAAHFNMHVHALFLRGIF